MVDLFIVKNLFFGAAGQPSDCENAFGSVNKAAVYNILRQILVLFQNDSFFLQLFGVDGSFQHLIVGCEYEKLFFLFVPDELICGFKGELFMAVASFYDGYHLFDFILGYAEHAKSWSVEFEAEDAVI